MAPSLCRLPSGVRLLAFERVFSAAQRRVYVKRRRPGFGWSLGRPVPLVRGDVAQRAPSLVCRGDGTVLLFVQVGDARRGRGGIRVYRSQGDSLRFVPARLWQGPFEAGRPRPLSTPYAALLPHPAPAAPVLLTATRLGAPRDLRGGCLLGVSHDGLGAPALRDTGVGHRCRTAPLSPRVFLQTFEHRDRLDRPVRAYARLSTDGGARWSQPVPLSPLQETRHAVPYALGSPAPGATSPRRVRGRGGPTALRTPRGFVLFVARLGHRTAILLRTVGPGGLLGPVRRLGPWSRRRWRDPAALPGSGAAAVYAAYEARPYDFDVVTLGRFSLRRTR